MGIRILNDKLEFFNYLKTDELTQKLGVEDKIKELTNDLFAYDAKLAENEAEKDLNLRNFIIEVADKFEKIFNEYPSDSENTKKLLDSVNKIKQKAQFSSVKRSPVLYLEDILSIAYYVGVSGIEPVSVRASFFSENALDKRIKAHKLLYQSFKKNIDIKNIDTSFIDINSNKLLTKSCAYNLNSDINQEDLIKELLDNSRHYFNREINLTKSYRMGSSLKEISFHTFFWIRLYAKRQAKINNYLFRTLYLTASRLRGDDKPIKLVEKKNKEFHKLWPFKKYASTSYIKLNAQNLEGKLENL
ncbi:hypothetical protein HOK51_09085 [Candidatus Woesearchaeota archaeon]|mgnify:CR=1 FL=1|jgi:hypothetical protein|nr:hypothetical protein [Candidatus Woesearchaeota archaeon]MBT6519983.1 hypothetical protein [Candidatus Woesearchaeota archaeon]MBT7367816.1 hypothetical protein [Candidatus Woesearchaeota archaeon]